MAEVGSLRISLGLESADFTAGMQDINNRLRALDSEMRAAIAGAGRFDTSLASLTNQQDILSRQMQVHTTRVEELRRQYDASVTSTGATSAATLRLATQYNNAVAAMRQTEDRLNYINRHMDEANGSTRTLSRTLTTLGDRLQDTGGRMQTVGQEIATSFGAATAALAAGLGLATKKAMDFEAQMSSVKSVMSPEEAKRFGDELKELAIIMGSKTKYSALEAAKGIEELVKAGVSVTDVLEGGLEGALSLATAGELDLADAAEIASTALNAFKDDGLEVGDAANILAGAANASATSVSELKFGLSAVAAVASGAGMNFKDTSTALAVFAQNGLKGSDAGTSLKTMLMNLTPSTDAASGAMSDLGIITKDGTNNFYTATGELKSLSEVTDVLRNALVKLNPQQRGEALKTMFGSDAIRAGNILFKEGADGIEKMAEAMDKIKAADVAAEKLNNLKGKMEELSGAFETGLISLGEALTPLISTLVAGLQSMVDGFNNLSPGMKEFIAIGGAVATAITGIIAALGVVIAIAGTAVTGFGALATAVGGAAGVSAGFGAALAAITGPIGIAVAAIVGLIAVFTSLYKNNEKFRTSVNNMWDAVSKRFQQAIDLLQPLFETFTSIMSEKWSVLWGEIEKVLDITLDALVGIINTATALINGDWDTAWQTFKDTVSNTIGNIQGLIVEKFTAIKDDIALAIEEWKVIIVNWFMNRVADIDRELNNWKVAIVGWFDDRVADIETKLNTWKVTIENWFSSLPSVIKEKLSSWKDAIVQWAEEQDAENKRQFEVWKKSIIEWFKSIPSKIIEALASWWNSFSTWFIETKDKILEKLGQWWTSISGWFKSIPSRIWTELTNWWNTMAIWFSEIPAKITVKLEEWWKAIKTWFTALPNKPEVKNAGSNMVNKMSEGNSEKKQEFMDKLGKIIVDVAAGALALAAIALVSAGREIIKRFIEGIKEIDLTEIGKDIVRGLIDGIGSMAGSFMEKARGIAQSIKDTLTDAFDIHSPSRYMRDMIGKNIGKGLTIGLDAESQNVAKAAERLANAADPRIGKLTPGVASNNVTKTFSPNIVVQAMPNASPADIARKSLQIQRQLAMEWGY